jgi:pimeloyl-ACP methyl ester carboxylesterase
MGDSDASFASYTPLDSSNDLVKLAVHLDLRNIVFLACSFSAASVIPASLELKDRVKGVVFLSPFAWDHPMPFGVPTMLWATLRGCTGASIWSRYAYILRCIVS